MLRRVMGDPMNVPAPAAPVGDRPRIRTSGSWIRSVLSGVGMTLIPVLALLLGTGSAVASQTPSDGSTYVVEGRVVQKHAAAGVAHAAVELEGADHLQAGATAADGGFRFEGVRAGGYTLRVLGEGYRPRAQYVWVEEDVVLILPVAVAPVPEDPSGSARQRRRAGSGPPRTGILRGVVRGGEWGLPLGDAEVLTNRGVAARTGDHGEFHVGGLLPDAAVLVSVRAFGYLPLDTVVIADGGSAHDFKIWRDPTVRRRILEEMEGLAARAHGHGGPVHTLEREALLASHESSVAALVRSQHGDLVRRIRCVVLDEGGGQDPHVLSTLVPGDLQRVELLVDPRGTGEVVARIYSRDFVRDLVARGPEARGSDVAYIEEDDPC